MRGLGNSLVLLLLVACGGAQPAPVREAPEEVAVGAARETAGEVVVEASAVGTPPEDGQLPGDLRPTAYALDLSIDPGRDRFSGEAVIQLSLDAPRRALFLHGQGLEVEQVVVRSEGNTQVGRWTGADAEDGFAVILVDAPVRGEAELRIRYSAPLGRSLDGLYRVQHGGDDYVFTQMEPLAARKAFPCFDEPRFKAPFALTLRVPGDQTAAGNAPVVEERVDGDRKVVRFAPTPPMPSYLFALAVGPFDVREGGEIPAVAGAARTPVPFRALAPRGRGDELAYTLEHTPAILQTL
ncbi:MAG: M1 family peptidase, partial [Myxococcota bacterium]